MGRRIYIGTASTPAAAIVDTAGQGGFWGVLVHHPDVGSASSAPVNVADRVQVFQFVLPFRARVANITWNIQTLDVGGFVGAAMYDVDKNLLMQARSSTTLAEVKTVSITPITLEPGVYWHAWTADTTVAKCTKPNMGGSYPVIFGENAARRGRAANASTAAVFPATLGAITTEGVGPMAVFFEP